MPKIKFNRVSVFINKETVTKRVVGNFQHPAWNLFDNKPSPLTDTRYGFRNQHSYNHALIIKQTHV